MCGEEDVAPVIQSGVNDNSVGGCFGFFQSCVGGSSDVSQLSVGEAADFWTNRDDNLALVFGDGV
jgi:hypothetical protein